MNINIKKCYPLLLLCASSLLLQPLSASSHLYQCKKYIAIRYEKSNEASQYTSKKGAVLQFIYIKDNPTHNSNMLWKVKKAMLNPSNAIKYIILDTPLLGQFLEASGDRTKLPEQDIDNIKAYFAAVRGLFTKKVLQRYILRNNLVLELEQDISFPNNQEEDMNSYLTTVAGMSANDAATLLKNKDADDKTPRYCFDIGQTIPFVSGDVHKRVFYTNVYKVDQRAVSLSWYEHICFYRIRYIIFAALVIAAVGEVIFWVKHQYSRIKGGKLAFQLQEQQQSYRQR